LAWIVESVNESAPDVGLSLAFDSEIIQNQDYESLLTVWRACRKDGSVAKAYVIVTEDVHDEAGMSAYARAAGASMQDGSVSVLSVDPNPEVLEGSWHGTRTVVMEFASVEAAHAWYDSESYQQAKPLRQAAADCNVVIVAGTEAPHHD